MESSCGSFLTATVTSDDSSSSSSSSSTSSYYPSHSYYTQVISDVDDTLKSSGGVNVAGVALGGIDVQYDRGDFYPGVAEFMLELSRHRTSSCPMHTATSTATSTIGIKGNPNRKNGHTPPSGAASASVTTTTTTTITSSAGTGTGTGTMRTTMTPPKVAILTARAEEFKVALELKDTSKLAMAFRKAGEALGIQDWGLGPVLYGSVAEWINQVNKGLRKFHNFEKLLFQQDPTGTILQYVYVGDTGELDQEAGETMLREYPQYVKAVFLHVVSGDTASSSSLNPTGVVVPPPKLINGRPLIFFRTYVGAAAKATQLQWMEVEGLERVMHAAQLKLATVPKTSDKWIDLERDLQEAHRTIQLMEQRDT